MVSQGEGILPNHVKHTNKTLSKTRHMLNVKLHIQSSAQVYTTAKSILNAHLLSI